MAIQQNEIQVIVYRREGSLVASSVLHQLRILPDARIVPHRNFYEYMLSSTEVIQKVDYGTLWKALSEPIFEDNPLFNSFTKERPGDGNEVDICFRLQIDNDKNIYIVTFMSILNAEAVIAKSIVPLD